jgi:hypothetical protein
METANFSHVEAVMSTIDDFDRDALIARLVGPLSPPDHFAFRRVAEDAIARVPGAAEDAVCRAVVALQRTFFEPPVWFSLIIGSLND